MNTFPDPYPPALERAVEDVKSSHAQLMSQYGFTFEPGYALGDSIVLLVMSERPGSDVGLFQSALNEVRKAIAVGAIKHKLSGDLAIMLSTQGSSNAA